MGRPTAAPCSRGSSRPPLTRRSTRRRTRCATVCTKRRDGGLVGADPSCAATPAGTRLVRWRAWRSAPRGRAAGGSALPRGLGPRAR
jgi:hypothetical protein